METDQNTTNTSLTFEKVVNRIKNKSYSVSYEEAIDLGSLTDVKYIWDNHKLTGVIIKKFDGLVLDVIY